MPCTYTETPEEIAQSAKQAEQRRNRELNKVTRLLCFVLSTLGEENNRTVEDVIRACEKNKELKAWRADHERRDAIREKAETREVVKKKALAKLSVEERRVLGLEK